MTDSRTTMNSTNATPPAPFPPRPRSADPSCPGRTRAGLPCRATPGSDGWCCNHSPRFSAEDRSAWGRLGAMSSRLGAATEAVQEAAAALPEAIPDADMPSFTTAAGVRTYLEKTAARVAANRLAPSQANAIAALAKLAIDLASLELDRDALEAEIEAQRSGNGGSRVRVVR
jgi:hypothetical protein